MPARLRPAASRATSRSRRGRAALVGLALVAVSLTGCGREVDPTSYSSTVKKNFIRGCEKGITDKPSKQEATFNSKVCTCIIGKVTDKSGIKFSDFAAAESKLRGDPKTVTTDTLVMPKLETYRTQCQTASTPTTLPAGPGVPAATTVPVPTSTTVKK